MATGKAMNRGRYPAFYGQRIRARYTFLFPHYLLLYDFSGYVACIINLS